MGAETYGFYFSLMGFSFIFNMLLDMGITNFTNRNISQHPHLATKHFSKIASLRLVLGVVYGLVLLLAGFALGYEHQHFELLLFIGINQFLLSFILYLRSNLAGLQLYTTDSVLSVFDRLLMIIATIFLFAKFGESFRIQWYVWLQSAVYFVTVLVIFVVLRKHLNKLKFRFDTLFFLMILKKSWPYALLALLMTAYNRTDSVMLERMLDYGSHYAGIYARGFRILEALSMVPFLFAGLLLPMFARMLATKVDMNELISLAAKLLFVPIITFLILLTVWNHELVLALFPKAQIDTFVVFKLLLFGIVPISSNYIFGTLLTAAGKLKYLNYTALVGFVLNIVLNLILIPKYQAIGAAYAAIITQYLTAIAQFFLAQKLVKFNVSITTNLRYFAYFVFIAIVLFLLKNQVGNTISIFVVSIFVIVSTAFLLKMINLKDLLFILKQKD